MRTLFRLLIGIAGVLALLIAARIWMAPAEAAAKLGLVGQGALGLATIRADLAGFFGGAGVFALAAAIRDDRRLLLPPLVLIGLALAGRVFSLAVGGWSEAALPPALIEVVLVAILAVGRQVLGKGAR